MIQIRVGKQKKKEKKKIYTENKIGRYVQFLIEREDFLELVASWLLSIEDERMQLLRQFIFEVELSETEELKTTMEMYMLWQNIRDKYNYNDTFGAMMNNPQNDHNGMQFYGFDTETKED